MLVLLALSIQTSFAVVSSYCQEEQVASRFAHHEHGDDAIKEVSSVNSNSGDTDCGVCHLAHSPYFSRSFSFTLIQAVSTHFFESEPYLLKGITPHPPEKPNWLALA